MPTMIEITKRSTERRLLALKLRRDGMTFRQIGEELGGITVETARCLVKAGLRIETRRMRYSFDPKCLELARYFYQNLGDDELRPLAQELQDDCEAFSSHLEVTDKCSD